jgi:hypothetical protein
LREIHDGKQLQNAELSWISHWNSYGNAAWETAKESGAVPYMDSRAISTYTWIYAQQEYVNATALNLFDEETRVNAALVVAKDPSKLIPTEVERLMIRSAEIDLALATLEAVMKALDDMYGDALTEPLV